MPWGSDTYEVDTFAMLIDWNYLGTSGQNLALSIWRREAIIDPLPAHLRMVEAWALKYRNVNPDLRMLLELMRSKRGRAGSH